MDTLYCNCCAPLFSLGIPLKVLVTGASSQIGHFLLPAIRARGDFCLALSRSQQGEMKGVRWVVGDLTDDLSALWQENEIDTWIHLAALPLALPHLADAAASGVTRFIGFSSTSVFTKLDSNSENERQMIEALATAEDEIKDVCQKNGVCWTLFRPTLIYGAGMDNNVGFIRSMIDRFGFFPVIGRGCGMRQPVHAADLAEACVLAMASSTSNNKAYNLSGGEQLTYRQMVERIFSSCNKPAKILHSPTGIMKGCISILRVMPKYRYLNQAMVDRMQMDMVFSHEEATTDFGYLPRPFQP